MKHPYVDIESWRKTGQPGHGVIEITLSSSDEDAANGTSLDKRSAAEKLLFHFVEEGNVDGMREVIARYPGEYNVNAKNLEGRDLCAYAVMKGDREMLRAVLREVSPETIDTYFGMMKAVKWNKLQCVTEIIQFEEDRRNFRRKEYEYGLTEPRKSHRDKNEESLKLRHEAEFGSEVTPLMMAAIMGHYEMIGLLYSRGERMPRLHYPSCMCKICWSFKESGDARNLEQTQKRIALLEARGSAEWLIFMSDQDKDFDCLRESIRLKRKVEQCMEEEVEWKTEYQRVLRTITQFPIKMVSLCRTAKEIRTLVKGRRDTGEKYYLLRKAVDREMKEFMAEANVQFILEQEFIGGVGGWNVKSTREWWMKRISHCFMMLYFPIFNLLLIGSSICRGSGGNGRTCLSFINSPESKFFMRLGSHKAFILILLILVLKGEPNGTERELDFVTFWFRWLVVVHVISHMKSIGRIFFQNPQRFFSQPWNRIQLLTCLLFWVSFACWFFQDVLGYRNMLKKQEIGVLLYVEYPLIAATGTISFAFAVGLSVLQLFRFTVLIPAIGRVQTSVLGLVGGKWIAVVFFILLTSISLSAVAVKMATIKPIWDPWGLMAFTALDGVISLFFSVTATGLFGSDQCPGVGAILADIEWRYQRAKGWLHFTQMETGLTPPFNLLCGCFDRDEYEEVEYSSEEEYPKILRTLFVRYFQRKSRNFK